jgi:hypothetical protein
MSVFYDEASLVVVPSGYKSGKIYAQKPLTTDGQLTFTRASTATRVNASGLIEEVASGVPRLDYTNSSCPKLLLEPQRTNLVQFSEQFDNADYWTPLNGSITANTQIAPDGTTSADTLTSDGGAVIANKSGVYRNNVIGQSTTTYNRSVYLKKGNTRYGWVSVLGSSFTRSWSVIFDFDTEQIVDTGGPQQVLGFGFEKIENGWYRINFYIDADSGTRRNFSAGMSRSSTSFEHEAGDTIHIWGAQLEEGTYATSYIKTEAAAVTRVADAASKTGISSLIGQTEGTLFVEITTTNDITTVTPIGISDGTGSNRVLLYVGAGTLTALVTVSGVAQASISSSAISANTSYKMAIAYKANDFAFYVNGVLVGTDTSGTVPACSKFNYDNGSGSAPFYGLNNQALLFKTRLSNAKLAELTSL